MLVEMYVGRQSYSWDSWYVSIPNETKEDDIPKVAEKVLLKEMKEAKTDNISFYGVLHYNIG